MERRGSVGIAGILILAAFLLLQWDGLAGKPAPDFTLDQAYGGRVDLSAYRGRPLLLAFWLTSCGICRHELPLLDRLGPEFSARGVEVLAVNIRDVEGAREFMAAKHLHLTNLIDADGETAQRYGVSGVPKLVLIGADGKIHKSAAGYQNEETLREWMASVAR
jgi:cytochrome c biogenesis protein CcmG/thiol:disulfide interchange protein DsbE